MRLSSQVKILAIPFAMISGITFTILLKHIDAIYLENSKLQWANLVLSRHIHNSRQPSFPTSWEDLRVFESPATANSETAFSLDEIAECVIVDWEAGQQCLAGSAPDSDAGTFNIISLRSGNTGTWHGNNPNGNLVQALRSIRRNPESNAGVE